MHSAIGRAALVLVAVTALLAAGCLQREYRVDVDYEIEETGRTDHDALGQITCLDEARASASTAACPRVETGKTRLPFGTLVLDDFYATVGPPDGESLSENYERILEGEGSAGERLDRGDPTALAGDLLGGSNPHRSTNGELADVIVPGFGTFWAALGYWDDADSDGAVRLSSSFGSEDDDLDSEWIALADARIYSWVEPGPRPAWTSAYSPDEYTPDFTYHLQGYTLYMAGAESNDVLVFLDGSLAQPMSVMTASDPALTPSPEGLPFTPRPGSRVDIDAYAALAPGTVTEAYGALFGPALNALGNPSFGWCPNACGFPVSTGFDDVDAALATAYDLAYPRLAPEWREGSGSSAAGRRDEFTSEYHGWLDLVPGTRPPGYTRVTNVGLRVPISQSSPVAPRAGGWNGEERTTVGPGYFAFDVWMGVWKDVNGDGYVGVAATPDPYEGGARPGGHNYLRPAGEFVGAFPAEQPGGKDFTVVLVPDEGWGPGVLQINTLGTPYDAHSTDPNAGPCRDPEATRVENACVRPIDRGAAVLSMTAGVDRSFGSDGFYRSVSTLLLPFGSPGFTLCTPVLTMRYEAGGVEVDEPVYDCDHVARYEGP